MKIAFYLQNSGIGNVDCRNPLAGNPGIGGTEYMFIVVPYILWSEARNRHQIYLLANNTANLPANSNCIEVKDDKAMAEFVAANGIDLVVFRYSLSNLALIDIVPPSAGIVIWAHNFIERRVLTSLSRNSKIRAIVCVGEEQLQLYRDHQAFYKSVAIFNAYPVTHFIEQESASVPPFANRGNEVTYMGNLVDFKGFHLLAKAWKKVVEAVPDAHLNVIGGGKLYDRTQKLGAWNLAEESYEQSFIPYLLDENGELLPSVTFHGVMGNEKSEVLNKTKVGVPNPSGVSETFCIAALEMQLYGSVIATINYGGFKDTVYATGALYDNPDELADYIISQLRRTDNDYPGLLNFVRRFDFKPVGERWIALFDEMSQRGSLDNFMKPAAAAEHKGKDLNRKIKKILPFGRHLPTAMFYNSILWRLKKLINK